MAPIPKGSESPQKRVPPKGSQESGEQRPTKPQPVKPGANATAKPLGRVNEVDKHQPLSVAKTVPISHPPTGGPARTGKPTPVDNIARNGIAAPVSHTEATCNPQPKSNQQPMCCHPQPTCAPTVMNRNVLQLGCNAGDVTVNNGVRRCSNCCGGLPGHGPGNGATDDRGCCGQCDQEARGNRIQRRGSCAVESNYGGCRGINCAPAKYSGSNGVIRLRGGGIGGDGTRNFTIWKRNSVPTDNGVRFRGGCGSCGGSGGAVLSPPPDPSYSPPPRSYLAPPPGPPPRGGPQLPLNYPSPRSPPPCPPPRCPQPCPPPKYHQSASAKEPPYCPPDPSIRPDPCCPPDPSGPPDPSDQPDPSDPPDPFGPPPSCIDPCGPKDSCPISKGCCPCAACGGAACSSNPGEGGASGGCCGGNLPRGLPCRCKCQSCMGFHPSGGCGGQSCGKIYSCAGSGGGTCCFPRNHRRRSGPECCGGGNPDCGGCC